MPHHTLVHMVFQSWLRTQEAVCTEGAITILHGGTGDHALSYLLETAILQGTPHPLYVNGLWVESMQLTDDEFLSTVSHCSWFLKQTHVRLSCQRRELQFSQSRPPVSLLTPQWLLPQQWTWRPITLPQQTEGFLK